mmetsp:Transcript_3450/g.5928  ORF Transcript_3450/g.5928 Transcript_3450/m.5928 type:complete len:202 (-) Transcript_3450:137-742(-)
MLLRPSRASLTFAMQLPRLTRPCTSENFSKITAPSGTATCVSQPTLLRLLKRVLSSCTPRDAVSKSFMSRTKCTMNMREICVSSWTTSPLSARQKTLSLTRFRAYNMRFLCAGERFFVLKRRPTRSVLCKVQLFTNVHGKTTQTPCLLSFKNISVTSHTNYHSAKILKSAVSGPPYRAPPISQALLISRHSRCIFSSLLIV